MHKKVNCLVTFDRRGISGNLREMRLVEDTIPHSRSAVPINRVKARFVDRCGFVGAAYALARRAPLICGLVVAPGTN